MRNIVKSGLCFVTKLLFKLLFRLEVSGLSNLPETNFIIAANHRSYLDPPLLLCSISPELRFIAKKELFSSIFLKGLLKLFDAIPVDRSKPSANTLKSALSVLNAGSPVAIFPEGTRTRRRLKAKTGISYLAHRSNLPVLPVTIVGTDRWYHFPPPKIKVIIHPARYLNIEDEHNLREVYQQFAEEVLDIIYSTI